LFFRTLARRYFGGCHALGGRLTLGTRTVEVVGIARDGTYSQITEAPRLAVYVPMQQWYIPEATLGVEDGRRPVGRAGRCTGSDPRA
jgi:hypothetical protein